MATVVGTVEGASEFTQAQGPSRLHTVSGVENEVESCEVRVKWTSGTYAQADDAEFNPVTAIQDAKRDGKAVTILSACYIADGVENGAIIGAGACTVAANVVTCPLLQEDFTERNNGAMSASWDAGVAFQVTYRQAADY